MIQATQQLPHLDHTALAAELHQHPGLIPIEIDLERRHIIWMDVHQYHFYIGMYSKEIDICQSVLALDRAHQPVRLTTDFNVLALDLVGQDAIPPTGFIFHVGRCGSSLLSRALAQSRSHLVWGEARLHNMLPLLLTDAYRQPIEATPANVAIFRNALLAMGRKRLATYQAHFIKFTTYQIHYFDLIQRAFPTVPKLFLYRDPAAVLVSYLAGPPAWEQIDLPAMHAWLTGDPTLAEPATNRLAYYSQCMVRFCRAALTTSEDALQVLNYNQLSAENLPAILAFFGVVPNPAQLAAMQAQFHYDAKAARHRRPFVADEEAKSAKVTAAIAAQVQEQLLPLYTQLEARPKLKALNFTPYQSLASKN